MLLNTELKTELKIAPDIALNVDKNNNVIFELVYADHNEDGVIDIAAFDKNEDNNFLNNN